MSTGGGGSILVYTARHDIHSARMSGSVYGVVLFTIGAEGRGSRLFAKIICLAQRRLYKFLLRLFCIIFLYFSSLFSFVFIRYSILYILYLIFFSIFYFLSLFLT